MILIISDLHFTDESTSFNIHPTAFENILGPEIIDTAKHVKATEIHIVLLGDIFDVCRTDWWLANNIAAKDRPWNGDLDLKTGMNKNTALIENQYKTILESIYNTDSFKAFTKMFQKIANQLNKQVKITYVIGNHDRIFINYPSLHDTLKQNFPNSDFRISTSVFDPAYGLLARHGHEWDEICHGFEFLKKVLKSDAHPHRFHPESYKVMALGEVITSELMGGLIYHVKNDLNLNDTKDATFFNNLKEVNDLRPMTDVFEWLGWFAGSNIKRYKDILHESLKKSMDALLDSELAKKWDDMQIDIIISGDLTDRLELVRTVLKQGDFDYFKKQARKVLTIGKIVDVFSSKKDSYEEGALKEWEIRQEQKMQDLKDIQFIVYGHTHEAKRNYFSGTKDDKVQMYINTGTYLPLIQKASDGKSFTKEYQMTMAFFYNKDENKDGRKGEGPTIDIWNGARRKSYNY